MKKRVTVQDIANELGLSRNTVSKAINGTGGISQETKTLVFKKAAELGYKQFAILQANESETIPTGNREIALFTRSIPSSQHLSSTLLDSFQKKISAIGYRLTIYILREDTISALSYPDNFNIEATDGILILELFDKAYTDFLCKQPIPSLFVDSYAKLSGDKILSDLLYMENKDSSFQLVNNLFHSGSKKIGFVGDYLHCHSFYERWLGYSEAMQQLNPDLDHSEISILDSDNSPYAHSEWLAGRIRQLPYLPDTFFCANDFIAICVIKALRVLNYSIPDDIKVTGFDNSKESEIIEPALTSVTLHGDAMGSIATDILMNRIKYPDIPYTITYVQTEIVYRESTK